MVLFVSSLDQH